MPLKVTVTKNSPGTFVVALAGSIDSETYPGFEKKVDQILIPATKTIIFNMKDVEYISSMGINVVFRAKNYMEKNGGSVLMADLRPHVKMVFDILKALNGMTLFESIEEMDKYLSNIQKKARDDKG